MADVLQKLPQRTGANRQTLFDIGSQAESIIYPKEGLAE